MIVLIRRLRREISGCERRGRKGSVQKRRQIVEVKHNNMSRVELESDLRKARRFSLSFICILIGYLL